MTSSRIIVCMLDIQYLFVICASRTISTYLYKYSTFSFGFYWVYKYRYCMCNHKFKRFLRTTCAVEYLLLFIYMFSYSFASTTYRNQCIFYSRRLELKQLYVQLFSAKPESVIIEPATYKSAIRTVEKYKNKCIAHMSQLRPY